MKRLVMVCLLSAFVAGCQDRQLITAPPGGLSADISDGAHGQSGNADFFFLPPLVGNPISNPNFDAGKFDPGLRPVVQAFRLPGGLDVCTGTSVYGPVVAPVEGGSEQYKVEWNTRASNLVPGVTYRICVFSSMFGARMGKLLGYLDVAPIDGGMRNARTGETYAFQDDRTLPIKFRIEKGALCAAGALECAAAAGVVAAGDTVVLPSKLAAVVIPDGAVRSNDTVTIVIAQQAPPAGNEGKCLPGDLVQSRGCYHFSTEPPNYQFASNVRLEACVNIDSLTPNEVNRLELYKYSGTGTPQMLPRADTTEIDCSGLVVGAADANAPTSLAGALWLGAQRLFANLVSPAALSAAPMATPPKGLGGLAGSFSDVGGAVPPATKLTFTVQPTNATAGFALAPAVAVAVQDTLGRTVAGSADTVTLAITSGTGTTGAVLGGTFTQVAVNGVATFANLTIDKAGSGYTLSATSALSVPLNGDTSIAFAVTAGAASASQSVVSVWQPTVASGGVDTLILQAKDALGNNLTTGGLAVVFTASGGTSRGTISPTNDWGSGRYTATFTGDTAGAATTIGAVINGMAVTSTLPTVTVTPGAVSVAQSVVSVWQSTASSGFVDTLILQAKDAYGNNLDTSGLTVVFTASGGTSRGTIGPTYYVGPGRYTATFTGDTAGTATTIHATINGAAVTSTLPTVTVTPGPVSAGHSVVSVWQPTAVAGGEYDTLKLQAKDAFGNDLTTGGLTVVFTASGGTSTGTIGSTNYWGNGKYAATFQGAVAGTATTIHATIDGVAVTGPLPTVQVVPGAPARLKFTVEPTTSLVADTIRPAVQVAIQDLLGNTVTTANDGVTLHMEGGPGGLAGDTSVFAASGIATFSTLRVTQPGDYTLIAYRGGVAPDTSAWFTVIAFTVVGSVEAGGSHTCGLSPAGKAYCWGSNSYGELGDGAMTLRVTPVAVAGGLTFARLAASYYDTCGLTSAGAAYCWGANYYGELGDGSTTQRVTPVAVAGGLTFASLTVGYYHTCGLTSGGAAYCWGSNNNGQLGDGSTTDRLTPVAVAGGLTFASLTAGLVHTCGLTSGGAAYCWGAYSYGQLGDGSGTWRTMPVAVAGGLTFASLTAGAIHTCGVTSAGAAYCWGANSLGQLGDGSMTDRPTPVAVAGGLTVARLAAGRYHTCGVTSSGAAYCWGDNNVGELGDGSTTQRVTPAAVAGGLTFASLTTGVYHTCGLASTGAAFCWGSGGAGQLGNGSMSMATNPVAVLQPPGGW